PPAGCGAGPAGRPCRVPTAGGVSNEPEVAVAVAPSVGYTGSTQTDGESHAKCDGLQNDSGTLRRPVTRGGFQMHLLSRSRLAAGWGIFLLWLITTTAFWWRFPLHPRATLAGTQSNFEVRLVAFSPDGHTLALTDERKQSLRLWDVATGQERFSIPI